MFQWPLCKAVAAAKKARELYKKVGFRPSANSHEQTGCGGGFYNSTRRLLSGPVRILDVGEGSTNLGLQGAGGSFTTAHRRTVLRNSHVPRSDFRVRIRGLGLRLRE